MRQSLIAFPFIIANSVLANPLPVLSGDHDGFTRIVLQLPSDVSWSADRIGQTVTITYSGYVDGFDDALVFEKILRTRVQSVSSTDSTFAISFGCNCDVAAFETGNGYLAIDVADPGLAVAELVPDSEGPLPIIPAAPEVRPEVFERRVENLPLPWVGSNGSTIALEGLASVGLLVPGDASNGAVPPLVQEEAANAVLKDAQERLGEEVADAASRGLLTPNRTQITVQTSGTAERGLTISEEDTVSDQEVHDSLPNNIRFSTSLDVLNTGGQGQRLSNTSGKICPADDAFAVEDWAEPGSFHATIGTYRRKLYGEFDSLDHNFAEKLAKAYVYFGFGAEALAVLHLDREVLTNNNSIAAIAEILELNHLRKPAQMEAYVDCSSNVALWAILSQRNHASDANYDSAAALRALNELPIHLRQVIAPVLSDRFLMHSDNANAAAALRSIERLPEPVRPDGQLAQANLSLKEGDTQNGENRLEEVLKSNTESSPEALVKLVKSRLEQNKPVSLATASLVEAYAIEYRGSEMGHQLQEARVLALVKSGQFDEAFAAMDEVTPKNAKARTQGLRATVLAELAATASDIVFLEYTFQQPDQVLSVLESETRNKFARRMLELGFASEANQIMISVGGALKTDDRLLLAEIELALGEPMRAQSTLVGIDSNAASDIRAKANELAGLHKEAHEIYVREGAQQQAQDAAWLSNSWADLINDGDPRFGGVAELAKHEIRPIDESEGMLNHSVRALEESSNAREVLNTFLSSPEQSSIRDQ